MEIAKQSPSFPFVHRDGESRGCSERSMQVPPPAIVVLCNIDLLELILSQLEAAHLLNAARVSVQWHEVAQRCLLLHVTLPTITAAEALFAVIQAPNRRKGHHIVSPTMGTRASVRGLSIGGYAAWLARDVILYCGPGLRSLALGAGCRIRIEHMITAISNMPELKELRLRCQILKEPGPDAGQQPLGMDALFDALVASEGATAGLTVLEVQAENDLSGRGFEAYLALKGGSLRDLELTACHRLRPAALRAVAACCQKLRHLTLRRLSGALVDESQESGAAQAAAGSGSGRAGSEWLHPLQCIALGCPELRSLVLEDISPALPLIPDFARLPHLHSLRLTRVSNHTSFLRFFPRLRHLTVSSCRSSAPAVASYPGGNHRGWPVECWPELETLSLLAASLTVRQLISLLRAAPRLRKLFIDEIPSVPVNRLYRPTLATPPPTPPPAWQTTISPEYFGPDLPDYMLLYEECTVMSPDLPTHVLVTTLAEGRSLETIALYGKAHNNLQGVMMYATARVGWIEWFYRLATSPWGMRLGATGFGAQTLNQGVLDPGSERLSAHDIKGLQRLNPNLINVWS